VKVFSSQTDFFLIEADNLLLAHFAIFAVAAWYAKQGRQWAFLIAIAIYSIDTVIAAWNHWSGLLSLSAESILSLGIHAWFLYTLADGLRACYKLQRVNMKR
jgi:hypothetical protein